MKKRKTVPYTFWFLPQYSFALLALVLSDSMLLEFFKKAAKVWRKGGLQNLNATQVNVLKHAIQNACEMLMKRELEK